MNNKFNLYDNVLNDFETLCLVSELVNINIKECNQELVYLPDVLKDNVEFRFPKYLSKDNDNNSLKDTCFFGRREIAEKLDAISKGY